MKYLLKFLACLALLFALLSPPPSARAADYAIQKTFWAVTDFTNLTATATNLAAAIDVTQFTDFTLEVVANFTNASAGNFALAWDTSGGGTAYGGISTLNAGQPGSSGWFAIPLTNSSTRVVWTTNITVNSVGYWRANWLTNASGQHLTNITVRGYVKPKRTNRDY